MTSHHPTVMESTDSLFNNLTCPHHGVFPNPDELYLAMGKSGTAGLYACSILVLLINSFLFVILIRKFLKVVPQSQILNLCWVTSLFTAISFFTCLMIFLPKATEFLLASYRVFEAMVIGRFVELNMMWYSGEKQLIRRVGENARMRFNLPPCCCCFLCLRNRKLTRERLKMVRLLVGQMIYIQVFMLFLQLVLQFSGINDGALAFNNPHTYIKFVGRISFLFGFWGLFVFFKIEHTFQLLEGFRYIQKFTVMKLILVLFIVQETLLEGLASRDVISCIPHLSGVARAVIINCCLVMVESILLGVANFYLYYKFPHVEAGMEKGLENGIELED